MKIKFPQGLVEVDLTFADLVKVDNDSPADSSAGLDPHSDDLSHPTPQVLDPVGAFFQKGAALEQETTGAVDFNICKAILSAADYRDKEPSNIVLRKDAVPDWSWSAPISDGLEKRATPARVRLNILLDRIFDGHEDFREEAAEIVAEALADERIAILSET